MPRVLVTRASHKASALAELLRQAGLATVLVPTIDIIPPSSTCSLDAAIASMHSFDWLLFTSANAVDAFAQRYELLQGRSFQPSIRYAEQKGDLVAQAARPRIAAIGRATARVVEQRLGAAPDLVPPQAVAESLAEALLPYAIQAGGTTARFLLVRAETAREQLPEALRAAGAHVTIAPAYRTVIPTASIDAMRALFADAANAPEAVAFTSSSTATNLLALVEAAGVTLPERTLRISIGSITSQTMRDLGIPPHGEASEPTLSALAQAVVTALERLPRGG